MIFEFFCFRNCPRFIQQSCRKPRHYSGNTVGQKPDLYCHINFHHWGAHLKHRKVDECIAIYFFSVCRFCFAFFSNKLFSSCVSVFVLIMFFKWRGTTQTQAVIRSWSIWSCRDICVFFASLVWLFAVGSVQELLQTSPLIFLTIFAILSFLESSDASPSAPIMFMYNLCFIIAKGARICLRALMFKEHIIPYIAAAFLFTLSETCTCVP